MSLDIILVYCFFSQKRPTDDLHLSVFDGFCALQISAL